jgi:hypothetical protein
MTKTPIFDAFVVRTPVEEAANGADIHAQPAAAAAGGEAVTIVSEESKSSSDRNINKYCLENTQYAPSQLLKGKDKNFGRAITHNPFLQCFGRQLSVI